MTHPAGVMESSYATDRLRKPHLRFRFRTRALIAHEAYLQFGNGNPAPDVVDFGAADGLTLLALRAHFRNRGRYTGIEYAPALIATAPPMPPGVVMLRGDVTALPPAMTPDSVDLVTALALLEHLSDPALAVREARRVLRPKGLFVASCPSPRWDEISTRLGLMRGEHHESHLDRTALVEIVTRAGLELCTYRPFMLAPVSFLPYLKIPVPVGPALALDRVVSRLPLTEWAFVNQLIVGRKG
jgi:SAM-dependent methyltransferase